MKRRGLEELGFPFRIPLMIHPASCTDIRIVRLLYQGFVGLDELYEKIGHAG